MYGIVPPPAYEYQPPPFQPSELAAAPSPDAGQAIIQTQHIIMQHIMLISQQQAAMVRPRARLLVVFRSCDVVVLSLAMLSSVVLCVHLICGCVYSIIMCLDIFDRAVCLSVCDSVCVFVSVCLSVCLRVYCACCTVFLFALVFVCLCFLCLVVITVDPVISGWVCVHAFA